MVDQSNLLNSQGFEALKKVSKIQISNSFQSLCETDRQAAGPKCERGPRPPSA